MTLLGKLLVFANVLLSFLMLSWAAGLYTNRIDWSASKAKGDKPAGQLDGRIERVKAATATVQLADDRWREARDGFAGDGKRDAREGLLAWEKRRGEDRVWYATELSALKTGPLGKLDAPIQRVKTREDGQAVLDPKNFRPILIAAERRKEKPEEAARPVYCYNYYEAELVKLTQQIEAEQVRYQDLIAQESELTKQAIGPKGLRQRITDELVKRGRAEDELADVAGRQKTNAQVETELLLARRDQLQQRKEELEKARKDEK